MDKERLSISPQCGFSTALSLADITDEQRQWAKLGRVVEVAGRFGGQPRGGMGVAGG